MSKSSPSGGDASEAQSWADEGHARVSGDAEALSAVAPAGTSGLVVPVRSLGSNHRARIARHLLALEGRDRYLRFGYHAQDRHIERYVDGMNFYRDEVFGIYNRKLQLIAVAHLAYPQDDGLERCVEFGVSVLPHARGRGYGARLFERAAMHASNDGADIMFIHALTENAAMLHIAQRAGAVLSEDGAEAQAHLRLPRASLESQLVEMFDEQVAQADYAIKKQAHQINAWLARLQAQGTAEPSEHV
ncbi:MAG: GNAT family N-acetyltransferase [Rhodoferax sp.]